jgi:hypothetical protein
LAIGVILNVSLAWSIAAWVPGVDLELNGPVDPAEGTGPWPVPPPAAWPKLSSDPFCTRSFGVSLEVRDAFRPALTETGTIYLMQSAGFGVPFRALRATECTEFAGWDESRISLPRYFAGIPLHSGARLPVEPLWPGFLANTLAYAAACYVALHLARAARGARRRRRGLCASCAHELAGLSPCPECGASTPINRRTAILASSEGAA